MSDHHEVPRDEVSGAVDPSSPPEGNAVGRQRSTEELLVEQAIANDTHGAEPPARSPTKDGPDHDR